MGKFFSWLVWILLVIGALNWGLFALNMNLFTTWPFTVMPWVVNPVQYLVGLAGIVSILMVLFGKTWPSCKVCK